MTKEHEYRISTLDDIKGKPSFTHIKTPEEIEAEEAERQRLYPSEDKASYLLYTCNLCMEKFYPIHPVRGKNMDPDKGGFLIISEKSKRTTAACGNCILELSRRNEPFIINCEGWKLL
jgi:hypothetical protein